MPCRMISRGCIFLVVVAARFREVSTIGISNRDVLSSREDTLGKKCDEIPFPVGFKCSKLIDESGATAEVYEAWDKESKKKVAVKLLKEEGEDEEGEDEEGEDEEGEDEEGEDEEVGLKSLLQEECNLASRLRTDHFNIFGPKDTPFAECLKDGSQTGIPYLSMELLGSELMPMISKKTQQYTLYGNDDIKKYATNLLEALTVLESNNLIHGDVKPPNILLRGNTAVLIDLMGVQTMSDTTKGLGFYDGQWLAPGNPGDAGPVMDKTTDRFALGLVIGGLCCRVPMLEVFEELKKYETLENQFQHAKKKVKARWWSKHEAEKAFLREIADDENEWKNPGYYNRKGDWKDYETKEDWKKVFYAECTTYLLQEKHRSSKLRQDIMGVAWTLLSPNPPNSMDLQNVIRNLSEK